jgi:hypothetical protein
MLSSADFLAIFPEFTGNPQIPTQLAITFAMNCGYLGLDEAVRPYAMALEAASALVASGNPVAAMAFMEANPSLGSPLGAQAIQSYKSHEDEIQFFVPRGKTVREYTNHYQRILNQLIENQVVTFLGVPGSCGGCSNGGIDFPR